MIVINNFPLTFFFLNLLYVSSYIYIIQGCVTYWRNGWELARGKKFFFFTFYRVGHIQSRNLKNYQIDIRVHKLQSGKRKKMINQMPIDIQCGDIRVLLYDMCPNSLILILHENDCAAKFRKRGNFIKKIFTWNIRK